MAGALKQAERVDRAQRAERAAQAGLANLAERAVAHNLPAVGGRQPFGVPVTQVVAVRFGAHAERPEYCHRVGVHVGERAHCCFAARDLAARPTGYHSPSLGRSRHRARLGSTRERC